LAQNNTDFDCTSAQANPEWDELNCFSVRPGAEWAAQAELRTKEDQLEFQVS